MYVCTRCQSRKPADGFSPDKRHRSGLDSICKACRAEHRRNAKRPKPEAPPTASVTRLYAVQPHTGKPEPVEKVVRVIQSLPGTRRQALEAAALATPGVLEPTNGAALDHARRIADAMDQADAWDRQMVELGEPGPRGVEVSKLNPAYLVALREAGLTPGPRKAKPAAEEDPGAGIAANY